MSSIDQVIKEFKGQNEKSLESLKRDLGRVRAGKASPNLLEQVRVAYYGQVSPLAQVANISTPDARTLMIAPWDASILPEIEKAINQSELGLTPQNDGKKIRLSIPALTEDRRKELVKQINKLGEEGKVAVRHHRKVANDGIKTLEKDKKISEDDSRKQQDLIQKFTDEAIKAVDDTIEKKSSEIMTV